MSTPTPGAAAARPLEGVLERARGVRLAVFDVDGVFTDGRLYLGPDGAEFKAFHVRDGHGVVRLRESGVTLAIISGRSSPAVAARMRELGIEHVHQGVRDKRARLDELLAATGIDAAASCFVGDDLPDLEPMQAVGLPIAVADACAEVLAAAAAVTRAGGGRGAVREVCDLLVAARTGA